MSIFDQKLIGKDNLGLLMKKLGRSQLTPDEMSAFSAIGDEGQIPSTATANRFDFITDKTGGFVPKGDEFQSIFEPKGKGFQLTDDFKNAPANREDFGAFDLFKKSQQDYLQDFIESDDYQKLNEVQKLFIENKLKQTKQDQQLSFLNQMGLQMGLVNPEPQMGPLTAFFNFGRFNPFQTTATDAPTVDPGLEALFAQRRAEEDAREKAIADQAKRDRRARDASQAQESRNQSRDDYTGGGGTVTIGKGGGETKTVSPRSREAMYAAPARTPDRGPLNRFNTGGLAELEGDTTTQNAPMFLNRRLDEQLGIGGLAGIEGGFNNRLPIIRRPGPIFGPQPMPLPILQPAMPDYSSQFEQLGEQLGGFGKQLDALGSFNEQVGGLGKQFEAVNNKLDSLEKGLGSLGNQLASFENMQKAEPQEVRQPQQPSYSPFGLANLFMNMRRF